MPQAKSCQSCDHRRGEDTAAMCAANGVPIVIERHPQFLHLSMCGIHYCQWTPRRTLRQRFAHWCFGLIRRLECQ